LITPDAGSVRIQGQEIVGAGASLVREVQSKIGMLFQNVALFDFMTVGDNVAFPLRRMSDLPEQDVRSRVANELSAVGLSGFEDRMPAGLSGGQKRRVGLARAAITGPRVLLYDEPAAGLDPVTTNRTFALLKEQRRRIGSTIVVVSSDIDRLLPITTQVAMMYRGRVLFQGTEASIRNVSHPVVRQFLEGRTDGPL
jgi:phospholipid/cholesterol/gamma-HCH transport system ATP-binding protein